MDKYLPTNCPNCGGVLDNGKCPYCGTRIMLPNTVDVIRDGWFDITLNFKNGNDVCVMPLTGYISSVEVIPQFDCFRDTKGMLHREKRNSNVRFEFCGEMRCE